MGSRLGPADRQQRTQPAGTQAQVARDAQRRVLDFRELLVRLSGHLPLLDPLRDQRTLPLPRLPPAGLRCSAVISLRRRSISASILTRFSLVATGFAPS